MKINYRLTITNPSREISYDNIVRDGDIPEVTYKESFTKEAIVFMLGKAKSKTFDRTFRVKIMRV